MDVGSGLPFFKPFGIKSRKLLTCGRPLMLCSEPHMAYLVGPCGHLGCIHPVKAVLVVLVHNGKVWSPMDSLKHRGPSRARPWPTLEPNPWLQTIAKIDGCDSSISCLFRYDARSSGCRSIPFYFQLEKLTKKVSRFCLPIYMS